MRQTVVLDDITGRASSTTSEVKITVEGEEFVLDLEPASKDALLALVRGDPAPIRRLPPKPKTATNAPDQADATDINAAVREWARAKGLHVADRGKVSGALVEEYRRTMAAE